MMTGVFKRILPLSNVSLRVFDQAFFSFSLEIFFFVEFRFVLQTESKQKDEI